jgi:hypothetical protein
MVDQQFGLLIWSHVAMVAFPALFTLLFFFRQGSTDEEQIFLDESVEHQEFQTISSPKVA